jgi:hypothetical protein
MIIITQDLIESLDSYLKAYIEGGFHHTIHVEQMQSTISINLDGLPYHKLQVYVSSTFVKASLAVHNPLHSCDAVHAIADIYTGISNPFGGYCCSLHEAYHMTVEFIDRWISLSTTPLKFNLAYLLSNNNSGRIYVSQPEILSSIISYAECNLIDVNLVNKSNSATIFTLSCLDVVYTISLSIGDTDWAVLDIFVNNFKIYGSVFSSGSAGAVIVDALFPQELIRRAKLNQMVE